MSLLKQPWLHFLLIGAMLFVAQFWLAQREAIEIPAPSAQKMAELRGQWLRSTGRVPSDAQLVYMREEAINREILFREALRRQWHLTDTVVRQRLVRDMRFLDPKTTASDDALIEAALAMELHENDVVVRRRLIQRMEMQAFAGIAEQEPDSAVLRADFEARREAFQHPATMTFEQRFFSRDRHADAAAEAQRALVRLNRPEGQKKTADGADPFLHGLHFERLSERQLARYFGVEFARAALDRAAGPDGSSGRWLGPVASSYGQHLLRIDDYQPARPKTFEEVRGELLSDWRRRQEQEALAAMIETLRQRYQVVDSADAGMALQAAGQGDV